MTSFQRAALENDESFERMLLEAARADALPSDVNSAWTRFETALAVGAVAAVQQPVAAAASVRAPRAHAAKWLAVGALGGSLLTALGMSVSMTHRAEPAAPRASVAPVAAVAPVAQPTAHDAHDAHDVLPDAPQLSPTTTPVLVELPAGVQERPHTRARAPAMRRAPLTLVATPASDARPTHSTLAAQVTLLDAARAALARGGAGIDESLQLTARYQKEFADGELAPEAEVVAIEALAERGDHAALVERANHFLVRYPADPHAAKVRHLAQR